MKNKIIFLLGFSLFFLLLCNPTTARAHTIGKVQPKERLLLVYDSLDIVNQGDYTINLMESLLTSLRVSVTTIAIEDYQKGQLNNFTGLIEIINQTDLPIENKDFIFDRDQYQQKRFHIGQQLPENWRNVLGSPLKRLYEGSTSLESLTFQASENLNQTFAVDVLSDNQNSKSFGRLNYDNEDGLYPYGSLKDGVAYLPFWQTTGLPYLIGSRLISEWLGINQAFRQYALLVFDDFTPVSNFELLRKLQKELLAAGLPFTISATGIWDNLETKAANKYLEVLHGVTTQNSSLFFQTPFAKNGSNTDYQLLNDYIETSLSFFLENKVYPVGIATPAYWNQDVTYQEEALVFSDTTLLLPKHDRQKRLRSTTNKLYQTAYVGLEPLGFENVNMWGVSEKSFFSPTAIVIPFPKTEKELDLILAGLKEKSYLFENSLYSNHKVVTTNHTLEVANQQFFLDGQRKWIESAIPYEEKKVIEPETSLTGFFATQNIIFTVFITGVLIVLCVFLVISYVLYKQKYRR